jgi:cellulose synthase (UDP-forming)
VSGLNGIRRAMLRGLILAGFLLGLSYIGWRAFFSVNWNAWFVAVPLLLAEVFSFVDTTLFGVTMWRQRIRSGHPPPPEGVTVDVLITCLDEPIGVIRQTVQHARRIAYPHRTWVLDDGASSDVERMAREEGVGYLTRGRHWVGKPRHAKAGNLNNALFETTGEFMLVLDADQVPDPRILHHTLGYFADPEVALVQTPQHFYNVPAGDPLGSQAPLFYGPIQQGKDGWNAAFFCGSNAVLRREALMRLGVTGYVHEVRKALDRVLRASGRMLRSARRETRRLGDPALMASIDAVEVAVHHARAALRSGETAQRATAAFQSELRRIARTIVDRDLDRIHADLNGLGPLPVEPDRQGGVVIDERRLERLVDRDWSPLAAIEALRALVLALDVDRAEEAQPVMPIATISVTEDLATAMRLHAQGWRSVYHDEVLAVGLAPEDVATMLQQRLRWAQGSLQVLLRENPLAVPGLTPGQRVMYLATMWSYLKGFAAVVYLAAPILFLDFGISPVRAFSTDFLERLLPYLAITWTTLLLVGWGRSTWRGHQYSLALFPLWIRATTSAVGSVLLGRSPAFVVTSKVRRRGRHWRLVLPQLATIVLLSLAITSGLAHLVTGSTSHPLAVAVVTTWATYDLAVLSVVVPAMLYPGPRDVPLPALGRDPRERMPILGPWWTWLRSRAGRAARRLIS